MDKRERRISESGQMSPNKGTSNAPKTKRSYQGEMEAVRLVDWLNTTDDQESKSRITNIIRQFLDINSFPMDSTNAIVPIRKEHSLNNALGRYQIVPNAYWLLDEKSSRRWRLVVGWLPAPGSQLKRDIWRRRIAQERAAKKSGDAHPKSPSTATEKPMDEMRAFLLAMRLMDEGLMRKISQCTCQNFFFLKFSHQRFCSQKCRIAEFQSSEGARQKRNEYARTLYHRHKQLDQGKRA